MPAGPPNPPARRSVTATPGADMATLRRTTTLVVAASAGLSLSLVGSPPAVAGQAPPSLVVPGVPAPWVAVPDRQHSSVGTVPDLPLGPPGSTQTSTEQRLGGRGRPAAVGGRRRAPP